MRYGIGSRRWGWNREELPHFELGQALSLAATRSATPPWDRLWKPAAPAETPPVRPPQSGFRRHPHRSPDLSMIRRTTGWKQVARGASPLPTRSRFPRQLDPAHPAERSAGLGRTPPPDRKSTRL